MAKPNMAPDELSRLKAAIKAGEPERLYFFHGEEVFLLHHYLNELRKKTIDELTQDFNAHRFTQETFSVQAFSDAVEALPMMAERTFVQVDEIDIFKLNETEREKMIEILSDVPDIAVHYFTERDVVRHRLVQKIIAAYEKYEKERAEKSHDTKAHRFYQK